MGVQKDEVMEEELDQRPCHSADHARARSVMRAIAFSLVLVLPTISNAESLAEGRRLYLDAEFRAAMEVFTTTLERDDLTDEEIAEAHSYLAALTLLAGDREVAREHATAAVLQDRYVDAPEGAPEAMRVLLDGVRERFAGVGEAPFVGIEADVGEHETTVEARVDPELEALVDDVVLRCVSSEAGVESATGEPPEVRLTLSETSGSVYCQARGVSRRGVEILRVRRELELRRTGRRRNSRWIWIGVGLGVTVATALAVALTLALRSEEFTIGHINVEGW